MDVTVKADMEVPRLQSGLVRVSIRGRTKYDRT